MTDHPTPPPSPTSSGPSAAEIIVTCPHCQSSLSIQPAHAGSVASCPHCEGKFQTPLPTAYPGGPGGPGYSADPAVREFAGKKIAAGVCGILFGVFGVHKFILGLNSAGIIMLLVSIFGSCLWIPTVVMYVIGFVEGIIYLTKSDDEFFRTYAVQKKEWF